MIEPVEVVGAGARHRGERRDPVTRAGPGQVFPHARPNPSREPARDRFAGLTASITAAKSSA